MASVIHTVGCWVTGETPFYGSMMQEWAKQTSDNRGIECYCLDAPEYIPSGVTKLVSRQTGEIWAQDVFVGRDGRWG